MSEGSRKFSGSGNQLRNNIAGLLYERHELKEHIV